MLKDENSKPLGVFAVNYPSKVMGTVARDLRNNPTLSEDMLWQVLRRKQLAGLKFRRQQVFGSSIVDFYCPEKRLVIEIDGAIHLGEDMVKHDKARQEIIEMYGVQFLRFTVDEVENDIIAVRQVIVEAVKDLSSY